MVSSPPPTSASAPSAALAAPGAALDFTEVRERISDYLELQVQQRELQHYLLALQERHGVRGLDEIVASAD